MGRAHHDGQELEHLPERRLGEEHSRARAPEKKLAVAQFGFRKKSIPADARHKSSPPPASLFLLVLLLGLHPTAVDTRRSRYYYKRLISVFGRACNT